MGREIQPAVYMLASHCRGTLYVGVTSDLIKRLWEHRNGAVDGFTRRYQVHALVYFERHECMEQAIAREKQIKKWRRAWKLELIEIQAETIYGMQFVAHLDRIIS
jgi:putative endonuclease